MTGEEAIAYIIGGLVMSLVTEFRPPLGWPGVAIDLCSLCIGVGVVALGCRLVERRFRHN
jgi:hypothetical protein